jgi:hypothetical protein
MKEEKERKGLGFTDDSIFAAKPLRRNVKNENC